MPAESTLERVFSLNELTSLPFLDRQSQLDPSMEASSLACLSAGSAALATEQIERDSIQYTVLSSNYDNCQQITTAYTGRAFLADPKESGNRTAILAGFDNLLIQTDGRKLAVTGAIQWIGINSCNTRHDRIVTLQIHDTQSGEQVLLDGMRYQSAGLVDTNCTVQSPRWTSFKGQLTHSSCGSVSVGTPTTLMYAIDHASDYLVRIAPEAQQLTGLNPGVLQLLGNSQSQARFAYDNVPIQTEEAGPSTTAELSIGNSDERWRAHRVSFLKGSLSNLSDCDEDGMPDSWEMVRGLNPLDDSDTRGKADDDRLSRGSILSVTKTLTISLAFS